jgi:hypothetical protein
MSVMDPVQVLRDKVKEIDGLLEHYAKHDETLKRERTALMVAIAALEARDAERK